MPTLCRALQPNMIMATLCLTQNPQIDYRLNQNTSLVNPLKFVPTRTSTHFPIEVNVDDNVIEVNKFPSLDRISDADKAESQALKIQEAQPKEEEARRQEDSKQRR